MESKSGLYLDHDGSERFCDQAGRSEVVYQWKRTEPMSVVPARSLFRSGNGTPFTGPEQERPQPANPDVELAVDVDPDCLTSLDDSIESCGTKAITCPQQSTTSFWDVNTELFHLVRVVCKTWSCPYCGPVKRAKLAVEVALARPNRFITLTTSGHSDQTPRDVFDATRRQLSELAKRLRKEHGTFEYLRALEQTKTGFPHYHLLVRSPYLDQHELSRHWCALTTAFIVDIRKLSQDEKAVRYVMKYLGKQTCVPFTTRRLSWTRNFFPPKPPVPKSEICAADVQRWNGSLEDVTHWEFPNCSWERINNWHWIKRGGPIQ